MDYITEDIPMDDYYDENTSLLPTEQEEHAETVIDDSLYETPRRTITTQRQKIIKQIVTKFYKHMGYDTENLELNLSRFKVKQEKGLTILYYEKNGKWYNLSKKTDGQFKTRSEIEKIINKRTLTQLGLSVKKLDQTVPTPKEVDYIEMDDLNATVKDVHDTITSELPLRELLGLDKALQSIQGEYLNANGKLSDIDTRIKKQKAKFNEANNDQQRERIKKRISELKEEREVRLESMGLIKEKLQTQFARMRQTIDKIADKDRTLKERLHILWREQGLTIISVLIAIGMTVSTLVLAILPGSSGSGGSSSNHPHKVRDWVKKSLNALGRLFGKIAKWALKALPGALGSIISWIFTLLKTIVSKAVEHTYAVIGFIAALVSYLVFKT